MSYYEREDSHASQTRGGICVTEARCSSEAIPRFMDSEPWLGTSRLDAAGASIEQRDLYEAQKVEITGDTNRNDSTTSAKVRE